MCRTLRINIYNILITADHLIKTRSWNKAGERASVRFQGMLGMFQIYIVLIAHTVDSIHAYNAMLIIFSYCRGRKARVKTVLYGEQLSKDLMSLSQTKFDRNPVCQNSQANNLRVTRWPNGYRSGPNASYVMIGRHIN